MKKRKTPDLEKYLEGKKRRFVNYTQGAKIYRMSYWPFNQVGMLTIFNKCMMVKTHQDLLRFQKRS